MKKILVPVDGSDNAMRALQRAKEIGEFYKAEITVLTVIFVDSGRFMKTDFSQDIIDSGIKGCEELLHHSCEFLEDYPYGLKSVYKMGDVANEIIAMAEEENFDLIVMGNRGLGAFRRALLGGVSQKVASHVDTTLMLVK